MTLSWTRSWTRTDSSRIGLGLRVNSSGLRLGFGRCWTCYISLGTNFTASLLSKHIMWLTDVWTPYFTTVR